MSGKLGDWFIVILLEILLFGTGMDSVVISLFTILSDICESADKEEISESDICQSGSFSICLNNALNMFCS
ncbi:MAG: hypothetical protein FD167_3763 [bacterium]|nr:MAG: hypothetical protein FD167_3763 [bacterium]